MTGNKSLLAIGAGVIALVVVTLAVVLLTDDGESVSFGSDAPEAALQSYLTALEDGDADAAFAAFSSDVRSTVDPDAFAREVDLRETEAGRPDTRYLVSATNVEGDTARVTVTIQEFYGEGLDGSTSSYDREIRLIREDGGWHIDEPLVWLEPAPYLEQLQ
jgi:hypothetical protein